MKQYYRTLLLGICLTIPFVAHAVTVTPQLIQQIPTAVDPGQLMKQINDRYNQGIVSSAPIKHAAEKPAEVNGALAKIKFKLNRVEIKGNTVFTNAQLESVFKSSYKKEISVAELQQLVDNVTTLYRSSGYILSRAILPPQTIQNGVVQVQVIEGYVSQLTISGQPGWVTATLNKYGEPVLQSKPLQIKTLERSLLLMNDLPGVSVKSVLNPSPQIPASSELMLVTEQQTASSYLSYDNYGTRYLGPQEIGAGVSLFSLTFPGSSDGVRVLTVPQTDSMQYIEYTHTNPIGSEGTKFTFGGNYINTRPQFVLSDSDIVGRSQLLYIDMLYPWIRSRSENFFIHGTANYQNVSSTILSQPFYADFFRTLVFGGEYSNVDRFRGINDIKIDLEKGFDIMGANQHLFQSRPLGVPNFFKTSLSMSRVQALPWQLSVLAAMNGQYAFEPLLATEQYAYGGPIWGRGYNPSEIVGDDGLAMTFELRRDTGYDFVWLHQIQYYLFYDAGIIWNRDGINLPPKQSATSTGFGTRVTFLSHATANFYYAKPLTHSIATQLAMNKDPLKPSIFFQLTVSY